MNLFYSVKHKRYLIFAILNEDWSYILTGEKVPNEVAIHDVYWSV